jgi:hypothetical protein
MKQVSQAASGVITQYLLTCDSKTLQRYKQTIINDWGQKTWDNLMAIKERQNSNATNVTSFTLAKPSRE